MTTARITQNILETLVSADSPNIRVTQQVLEIMTFVPAPAARLFPIIGQQRITSIGTANRVFPPID